MEITIKHYGYSKVIPSSIIELTIIDSDTELTFDVTNNESGVDVNLIENLRRIADELEEQNTKLKYYQSY